MKISDLACACGHRVHQHLKATLLEPLYPNMSIVSGRCLAIDCKCEGLWPRDEIAEMIPLTIAMMNEEIPCKQ